MHREGGIVIFKIAVKVLVKAVIISIECFGEHRQINYKR